MQPLRVPSDFGHNGQRTNSYAHKLVLYYEGAIAKILDCQDPKNKHGHWMGYGYVTEG